MRRRVTVSPSNAPAKLRSAVYLDFGVLRGSGTNERFLGTGGEQYRPGGLRPRPRGAETLVGAAQRCGRLGPCGLGPLGGVLRVLLRTVCYEVGEDRDRLEVAERGEPVETERVEPVAGQQREV